MITSNVPPLKETSSSVASKLAGRWKHPLIVLAASGGVLLVLGIILGVVLNKPAEVSSLTGENLMPFEGASSTNDVQKTSSLHDASTKPLLSNVVALAKQHRFVTIGVAVAVVLVIVGIVVAVVVVSTSSESISQSEDQESHVPVDKEQDGGQFIPNGGQDTIDTKPTKEEEPDWVIPVIVSSVIAGVLLLVAGGVVARKYDLLKCRGANNSTIDTNPDDAPTPVPQPNPIDGPHLTQVSDQTQPQLSPEEKEKILEAFPGWQFLDESNPQNDYQNVITENTKLLTHKLGYIEGKGKDFHPKWDRRRVKIVAPTKLTLANSYRAAIKKYKKDNILLLDLNGEICSKFARGDGVFPCTLEELFGGKYKDNLRSLYLDLNKVALAISEDLDAEATE